MEIRVKFQVGRYRERGVGACWGGGKEKLLFSLLRFGEMKHFPC